MMITFKFDTPIDEYFEIVAGTKVTRIEDWNEYLGFTAIEYEGIGYYFSNECFVECELLDKLNENQLLVRR